MPLTPALPSIGRPKVGAADELIIPGVLLTSGIGVFAPGANGLYYFPIYVSTPLTVTGLLFEQTAVGGAGTTARMGIYNCDSSLAPSGAPLVDTGTIATDGANAVKESAVNVPLAIGRYLLCWHTGGGVTVRFGRGASLQMGYPSALGASIFSSELLVTTAYGAFATPGVAYAIPTGSGSLPPYFVWCRVTYP